MSLSTYADLQTQVANWLARSDLTAYIPDMITLFEATAARRLRVRAIETDATATPTNGQAALPSDFLSMRRLTLLSTPYAELQYVGPQDWANFWDTSSTTTGTPQMFTLEGNVIKLKPQGDDTANLEIIYYAKTPALSGTLNWLYTNHPDAYLFGTLAEANAFNKDVDKAGLWKARRDEIFEEIQMQEFRDRDAGMVIKLRGQAP